MPTCGEARTSRWIFGFQGISRLNCDLRKIAVNLVPFPRGMDCRQPFVEPSSEQARVESLREPSMNRSAALGEACTSS